MEVPIPSARDDEEVSDGALGHVDSMYKNGRLRDRRAAQILLNLWPYRLLTLCIHRE